MGGGVGIHGATAISQHAWGIGNVSAAGIDDCIDGHVRVRRKRGEVHRAAGRHSRSKGGGWNRNIAFATRRSDIETSFGLEESRFRRCNRPSIQSTDSAACGGVGEDGSDIWEHPRVAVGKSRPLIDPKQEPGRAGNQVSSIFGMSWLSLHTPHCCSVCNPPSGTRTTSHPAVCEQLATALRSRCAFDPAGTSSRFGHILLLNLDRDRLGRRN